MRRCLQLHSPYFGYGIVGGHLMSMDDLASNTANSAIRILNGAPASSVSVPPQLPGQAIFDWRELQRWRIDESRLPAGSEVRYRRPSLWSEYRTVVLVGAGALAIQALLIVGLLFERRARLRAEIESRKNLTLAADTSRRVTMSALTGSIAHELSQPLSAMMYNAEALQLMINASRATTENITEILADIHADGVLAGEIIERHRAMLRSRKIEKKQVDLQDVVSDTLALVAHDIRERQVEVSVDLPANSCRLHGDPVLLEQVLVNLVINAMDAMEETPPDRRHITISSEVRGTDIEIVRARHRTGIVSGSRRQAVHAVCHDKVEWRWNWPRDRPNHRRSARWQHRRAQQSRRGCDLHGHAASQRRARGSAEQARVPGQPSSESSNA